MKIFSSVALSLALTLSGQSLWAHVEGPQGVDEINPFDSSIETSLQEMIEDYQEATGKSAFLESLLLPFGPSCYQISCPVFAHVDKSRQQLTLYVNGSVYAQWPVSTGASGHETPDMDTHPNGLIFDAYSSKKYPGGDYNGLGNMPYAVFIRGGFAIHGTPRGNWQYLGRRASHGCIRVHPDNGYIFNRLVRQYGVRQTWITVD